MKAKVTLLIQMIGMYLMQLPLLVAIIIDYVQINPELQTSLTRGLFIATFVMLVLMIPICIVNVVFSLVSVFKDDANPTKITMIVKLCLIPWYALNFIFELAFTAIFFNPFTFIAIPVVVAIFVLLTYLLMVTTSIADLAYAMRNTTRKKWRIKASTVFAVIFLFVFCLDVIGAIMLYFKSKKVSADPAPLPPAELDPIEEQSLLE